MSDDRSALAADIRQALDGVTPDRCPATLGTRPSWMGVDQYDPCCCRLPNGHDGDHECSHGTEPNWHPGEKRTEAPTSDTWLLRALLRRSLDLIGDPQ